MDWQTIEIHEDVYKQFEAILDQLHDRGLLVVWGGDSRVVDKKRVNFYEVQLNARFLAFIETVKAGAKVENPVQQKMLDFAIAAGIDMTPVIEETSVVAQTETVVTEPETIPAPKPYDVVASSKRMMETQKREQMERLLNQSTEGRMVMEIAHALNLSETEQVKLWCGLQILRDARWSHPLRREDRVFWLDLQEMIARTNAALPLTRAWISETREMVG